MVASAIGVGVGVLRGSSAPDGRWRGKAVYWRTGLMIGVGVIWYVSYLLSLHRLCTRSLVSRALGSYMDGDLKD